MTNLDERMGDVDHVMWAVDANPALRSVVHSVSFYESPIDRDALLQLFARTAGRIRRFRQRVAPDVALGGTARWEADPDFDIARHVRWLDTDRPLTEREILDLAGAKALERFDPAHPLWGFTVIDDVVGAGAALVFKAHHAIADGQALLEVYQELVDFEPDPDPAEDPPPELPAAPTEEPTTDVVGQARHLLNAAAENPSAAARTVLRTGVSAARALRPMASPLSPVMTERAEAARFDTLTRELAAFKDAAKRAGGTINDVFVASLCDGLRRYHEHHGALVNRLRLGMPISVRKDEPMAAPDNQITAAQFEVPMRATSPDHYVRAINRIIRAERSEPALGLAVPLATIMSRMPSQVIDIAFGQLMRGMDFQASNMRGSPLPVWLRGSRLLALYPYGPTTTSAMNVTLVSYVDDVHIGVATNPGAVPDPEVMLECLGAGMDHILAG